MRSFATFKYGRVGTIRCGDKKMKNAMVLIGIQISRLLLMGVLSLLPFTSVSAQDLPVIGISTIKETVNDRRRNAKGANFQTMLETQMTKVGRFKLIERGRVDEILAEQGLNNEVGDGQTAGGAFNVAGVDYLVYGSITKLGQTKGGMATGQFATASLITEMSVDIKVVDASTGEIRKAETANAKLRTAGAMQTRGFATANSGADPLADVQRLAAKQVAAMIATSIFPIEVVKGGDIVYLNYGTSILDVGDVVTVFRPGEVLIDETTGINLGSEEELLGELEVFETTDKFSKARMTSGSSPSRGDLVRITNKASAKSGNKGKASSEKRGRSI